MSKFTRFVISPTMAENNWCLKAQYRYCVLYHSIEKETVCSSASDGGFLLETFDDVIKYNTGKSLLCFLKIGGNHEVQLLQLL